MEKQLPHLNTWTPGRLHQRQTMMTTLTTTTLTTISSAARNRRVRALRRMVRSQNQRMEEPHQKTERVLLSLQCPGRTPSERWLDAKRTRTVHGHVSETSGWQSQLRVGYLLHLHPWESRLPMLQLLPFVGEKRRRPRRKLHVG